ncbi:hypothetical protein [Yersinia pseudotuberculosis]|uniref:hypothetical protein n=1 Tax=Yersinia pseudotuberculosis TaxID=633 RepID=UPI001561FA5C|nr:hypothetical protein [Yersinia pseudotuberculosis]
MEVINKVPVARRIRRIKGGKLQVGLSVCRSVGLSVCRSVGLSVCRSVGLSVCRSVGLAK